jgi:4-methyl-5(b-hydroxyethyl)-thiazole monophosphate biosynthesis
MNILLLLADGFEEIEAVIPLDVLRRAGLNVKTAFINQKIVRGSHDISLTADLSIDDVDSAEVDAVICPGGLPGSDNLQNDNRVIELIRKVYSKGSFVAAICAAPRVLFAAGILENKSVTCFPGTEKLFDETVKHEKLPVVVDGNIVTGVGAGSAYPFAFKLVELLVNKETADILKNKMIYSC